MNVPHSPEFFEQMRGCRDAYRLLGECFHDALLPLLHPALVSSGFTSSLTGKPIPPFGVEKRLLSLMDVGCGVGAQTARLSELGWAAVGVDPFDVKPEPGFAFRNLDIVAMNRTALPWMKYDAVLCTETAEHVEECRALDLVRAVVDHAERAIIWSAAVPGQEWEGHVNLQPHEYWLEKFRETPSAEQDPLGWIVNDGFTQALRAMIVTRRAQHWMAAGNFYILVKEESA